MENNKRIKCIVLTGPTAVGKSSLSIALAKELNAEIISADSMQVYRHMDIGTDKIPVSEREGVPHHLIDILEPLEPFNVYLFRQYAKDKMKEISDKGRIPLIVGGTGFYIQALLYDIDFEKEDDVTYRTSLETYVRENGEDARKELHARLRQIDPDAADLIHPNNVKRVIRALSFYRETSGPISEHNRIQHGKPSPYEFRYFVLTAERQLLYERINKRVDEMMARGFLNEVQTLKDMGVTKDMTSMQALGYRELYAHLDGAYDLDTAVDTIKQGTRHFAKRQLTWFRREKSVTMIHKDDFNMDDSLILSEILKQAKEITE